MINDHDLIEKHKRFVFLDDIRKPEDAYSYMKDIIYLKKDWIIVRDYYEFINDIKIFGISDFYSFDHDLSYEHYDVCNKTDYTLEEYYLTQDREMTGYDCAKWLVEYCIDNDLTLPKFEVHSMNIVGGENIRSLLNHYNRFKR